VWLVRRLVLLMHRKSRVLDQFLQQVLSLSAQDDLGISVHQFAVRAKLWSRRWMVSTLTMVMISFLFYRWTPHYGVAGSAVDSYEDVFPLATVVNDDEKATEIHLFAQFQECCWLLAPFLLLSSLMSSLRCHQFSRTSTTQSSFSRKRGTTTANIHARFLLCIFFFIHRATPLSNAQSVDGKGDDHDEQHNVYTNVTRIGFGSCHKNIKATNPPIWNVCDKDHNKQLQHLHAWLWLGDTVYGPKQRTLAMGQPDNISVIQQSLHDLKTNRTIGYLPFLERNPDMVVAGIWDDHDFGGNDMGSKMPNKMERRELLWDFLEYSTTNDNTTTAKETIRKHQQPTRWDHDGMYHRVDLEHGRVRILALDTRWFRESHCIPSAAIL
jgi:hypothetical protein